MKTELQINAFKISRFAVDQELIQLMRGPSKVAGMGVHDEHNLCLLLSNNNIDPTYKKLFLFLL